MRNVDEWRKELEEVYESDTERKEMPQTEEPFKLGEH